MIHKSTDKRITSRKSSFLCFVQHVTAVLRMFASYFRINSFTAKIGSSPIKSFKKKKSPYLVFFKNIKKQIALQVSAVKEDSFNWPHHRILSKSSIVSTTLPRKKLSRSCLQVKKTEKLGHKSFWKCRNWTKSSEQLPSFCIITTRNSQL